MHPTANSTATYTDIVAGCTGAMPNLPKKVALAAGVRALADWIAQNALAGGVPLVPLAELYDEKIDTTGSFARSKPAAKRAKASPVRPSPPAPSTWPSFRKPGA